MNAFLTAVLNGMAIGVVLTVGVWLALRVFHRWLNATTRHIIWWLALLIQIALPAFLFYAGAVRTIPPMASSFTPENQLAPLPGNAPAIPYSIASRSALPVIPLVAPNPVTWNPGLWSRRIVIAWAFSSGFLLLRLCLSYLALKRKKQCAAEPPSALDEIFHSLLTRYAVRRRMSFAIIPEAEAPVAAGPFRPCVLLPQRLIEILGIAELEQVCLHEIAHLARFDDVALVLQRAMEAVLFFHPAVRWIAGRIDLEREIASDDFVVAATGRPGPYAECLVRVVELFGLTDSQTVSAIGSKPSQLVKRIDMLLDKTRRTGTRVLPWRFALSSMLLLTAASVGTRAPQFLTLAAQNAAPATQRSPMERFEVVRVPVSVTDPLDRFVTGMDKSSFRIFDNNIEQRVAGFVSPDAPISLSIVWDVAERSEPPPQLTQLRRDKEALRLTYTANHPSIHQIDSQIAAAERADKEQRSGRELLDFLSRHNPRDRFSLSKVVDLPNRYTSLLGAIRAVGQDDPRSAMLIVSDFKWALSHHSESELREALAPNVPLYVIGVGEQLAVSRDTPGESSPFCWRRSPNRPAALRYPLPPSQMF